MSVEHSLDKAVVAAARAYDRSAVDGPIRVYVLAKALGTSSKQLTGLLADMGLKKVAQSSLNAKELASLLDRIAPPAKKKAEPKKKPTGKKKAGAEPEKNAAPEKKTEKPAEDEDKLRYRVRKGVDNEIRQLEDKVEGEIKQRLADTEEEEPQPEQADDTPLFVAPEEHEQATPQVDEPVATKGSTRLEAQRRRRSELREAGRQRAPIVTQAEFLARRESVDRVMVVRERRRVDGAGSVTQVGVLEDNMLVEHFVTSDAQASMIGNIYLGRVQNVLGAMEGAFIDIGVGRNGALYASDVDWRAFGAKGRSHRIEQVLKSGDLVVVQVTKDPIGHKGPRLSTQISLAGRYLVYVPGGHSAGISRKLPAPERKRLKEILGRVVPGKGGAIIRTAAENVSEEAIAADVQRLHTVWEDIQNRAQREKDAGTEVPTVLYEEPNMLVKVVRDLFNEDFSCLLVDGTYAWNTVHAYIKSVAPDLLSRLERYDADKHGGTDAFQQYRVDEQIQKALARKVWLPSGGYLIIDQTEAMVVIDVNTGKFTGAGGNLEETVTRNNLEAAEEIVRQIRLRDLGGMIVVDFIDMVLPENQELVLRRLKEALGRDRTRHQVSEVTSLGLVQLTRKRLGNGLMETFATECEHCQGRGIIVHEEPVTHGNHDHDERRHQQPRRETAAKPQPEKSTEQEIDELVDSVLYLDQDDEDEAPAKGGRRRGRRGGNRGRGETKSYEEELAEFEASPRRRRRTRGNSRSDHRPTPPATAEKSAAAEDAQSVPVIRGTAIRRRRRAVRRTSRPIEYVTPQLESKQEPATAAKAAPAKRSGRGRRRAVRRTSR